MTITVGWWLVPLVLTVIMGAIMFRPYQSSGAYDFTSIFRLGWLIPILALWVIYLAIF